MQRPSKVSASGPAHPISCLNSAGQSFQPWLHTRIPEELKNIPDLMVWGETLGMASFSSPTPLLRWL